MRVPTPAERGQQTGSVLVDPLQPVFQNTQFANNQEFSQNVSRIGDTMGVLAGQIAEKRDRVAKRGAQQAWQDFEREISDPQSGIYTQQGMDANGATDRYAEAAAKKREEIMAEYGSQMGSGTGKAALDQLLSGREQEIWGRVASHESGQLDQAEQALLTANLEYSVDRASTFWNDDGEFNSAITRTVADATSMAEGQEQSVIDETVQAETTKVVVSRAERLLENAPDKVEEFIQQQIDAGFMDQTAADAWLRQNEQNIVAAKARVLVDGSIANSTPTFQVADPVRGTPIPTFIDSMITSESSGRADASVTIDDGRTFAGLGGVGQARLSEMIAAGVVPKGMTLAEFATAKNADIQRAGLEWHFRDIDKAIDATGALNRGYSRDGLRAVAHLGGQAGMRRFINSGGRYNPNDSYTKPDGTKTAGTHLSDYYNKFSGASIEGMTADQRIAAETDPRVREEAFATIDRRRQRQYQADQRLSNEVTTQIVTDYETAKRDGSEFDINEILTRDGVMEALGDKVETVREYVRRQEAGVDVPTLTTTVQEIEALIAADPAAFADRNLIAEYGDELSDNDMKQYLREQTIVKGDLAKPPDEKDQWTRAGASTLVTDVTVANGIDDKVIQSRILGQALTVARSYALNNNGAKMTDGQLSVVVRQLSSGTVAVFDPQGYFGDDDAKYGEGFQTILAAADRQDISEFLSGSVDLQLTYQTPQGPVDRKITGLEFTSAFEYVYEVNGAPPSASEVIMMLQLYPPDDIEE